MTTFPAKWHQDRHGRILAADPTVRALHGPDPLSPVLIVALVGADVCLAWLAARTSWPIVALLSFSAGAFVTHGLGVLIHEGTHNLVARGSRANKLWLVVANLPLLAPAAIEFRAQHLLHHKYLGEVDGRDTQAPLRAEIAWVGTSGWRKLASFSLGRLFYAQRPASRVPLDGYLALNRGAQVVATALLFWLVGLKGLGFLALNAFFAFGPHPLGARRLSEHFAVLAEQPTVSYYGPLNLFSFNVGYHVEQHDFPAIAWRRLPALRRRGGEAYSGLFAFRSWSRLLFEYFANPRLRIDHYVGFGKALADDGPPVCPARQPRPRASSDSSALPPHAV